MSSCHYIESAAALIDRIPFFMPPRLYDNVMTSLMTFNQRPYLVVSISARAMSFAGFGLSLLAIWLGWLMPAAKLTLPASVPRPSDKRRPSIKSSQRRSVPLAPPTQHVPTPPIPIRIPRSEDAAAVRVRRVYFVDSPISPPLSPNSERHLHVVIEESTDEEEKHDSSSSMPLPKADLQPSFISMATTPVPLGTPILHQDPGDIISSEFDSSTTSSRRRCSLSRHLKMKHAFGGKRRRSLSRSDITESSPPQPGDVIKVARRSSAPWSLSRSITDSSISSKSSSKSSHSSSSVRPGSSRSSSTSSIPTSISSCSSHSRRKAQRRTSAPLPIPRTLPYEAPYFAAPPILEIPEIVKDRSLRRVGKFAFTIDDTEGQAKVRLKDQVQVTIGHRHKRKSASESWAHGSIP